MKRFATLAVSVQQDALGVHHVRIGDGSRNFYSEPSKERLFLTTTLPQSADEDQIHEAIGRTVAALLKTTAWLTDKGRL